MNAEKPSHASKIKQETALSSLAQQRDPEFGGSIPMLHDDIKPQLNMRIPIYCPDFNSYFECPEKYLPQEVRCTRDASHKTHRHTGWKRFIVPDHVNKVPVSMFKIKPAELDRPKILDEKRIIVLR